MMNRRTLSTLLTVVVIALGWLFSGEDVATERPAASQKDAISSSAEPGGSQARTDGDGCSLPGRFDSHVLAISWQPAFCEANARVRECGTLHRHPFAARQFSLHGLWPNRRACGRSYGYCGAVGSRPSGGFCQYPKVPLEPALQSRLEDAMPSAAVGSCLMRHEWWKHGTCWSDDPDDYYATALDLLDQVNGSSFVVDFIAPNVGQEVTREALYRAFDAAFGSGAREHVELDCRDGNLLELKLSLPESIGRGSKLGTALGQAAPAPRGDCRARFRIDALD